MSAPRAMWIAALLASASCDRESSPRGDAWFVEDARAAGLDFVHQCAREHRFELPEIMSGGAGLFDFDGDGDLDVYCVQGGDLHAPEAERPRNRLYENRGGGRFVDVTERAGVGDSGYGMGCACADFDNDGDVDLYVTNVGPNVLYRNDGDGTFTDVGAAAGVAHAGWSVSAGFVDLDLDGWLDLVVVNYLDWSSEREIECTAMNDQRDYCSPVRYRAPAPAVAYRNRGDGTFEDASERLGLRAAFGNGLGLATGTFTPGARPGLFVANDMTPNHLWLAGDDGRWHDDGLLAGCALNSLGFAASGMGVHAVDLESDGDLDVFVTHLRRQGHALYVATGQGLFEDQAARAGLLRPSLPFTGFGTGFADFDHDGDLDLYVANGRVTLEEPIHDPSDPYSEESQLFEQTADGRFAEVLPRGGVAKPLSRTSRAAGFGDLDDDGDVDVVVINRDAPLSFLRNQAGARGHWIGFRVLEEHGRDALGARVEIRAGGRTQMRDVQTVYSYAASNDPRVHFGLGASESAETVRVRWPSGAEEDFGPLRGGERHVLRRGQGRSAAR